MLKFCFNDIRQHSNCSRLQKTFHLHTVLHLLGMEFYITFKNMGNISRKLFLFSIKILRKIIKCLYRNTRLINEDSSIKIPFDFVTNYLLNGINSGQGKENHSSIENTWWKLIEWYFPQTVGQGLPYSP